MDQVSTFTHACAGDFANNVGVDCSLKQTWMCGTGMRQGRVIKPPVAPASDKKMDGVLAYNEGQASFNCSFGAFQVG